METRIQILLGVVAVLLITALVGEYFLYTEIQKKPREIVVTKTVEVTPVPSVSVVPSVKLQRASTPTATGAGSVR